MVKPTLVVAVLFRTLDTLRMFDLPYGMIGAGQVPGGDPVGLRLPGSRRSPVRCRRRRTRSILFVYVLLVAYLFVKVLGADVIGDSVSEEEEEEEATTATQRRSPGIEMMGGAH